MMFFFILHVVHVMYQYISLKRVQVAILKKKKILANCPKSWMAQVAPQNALITCYHCHHLIGIDAMEKKIRYLVSLIKFKLYNLMDCFHVTIKIKEYWKVWFYSDWFLAQFYKKFDYLYLIFLMLKKTSQELRYNVSTFSSWNRMFWKVYKFTCWRSRQMLLKFDEIINLRIKVRKHIHLW